MTRIVIISDTHCGHRSGLTPPAWQYQDEDGPVMQKYYEIQKVMWEWYSETLESLQPIDRLICNGDAIDGKSDRSGGTELITSDRRVQCQMAQKCIEEAHAKRVAVIKGTPYHTGEEEDWEEILADMVHADRCGYHEWFDANGIVIDCRHAVGGSQIPHGRHTALARAVMWNRLWAEREMQPKANVLIRSHVHYHVFNGGAGWLAMTTPSLQAYTKFGSRMIDGTNDIGLISIDVEEGTWGWKSHLLDMRFAAARAVEA